MCRQIPDKAKAAMPDRAAVGATVPGRREWAAAKAALLSLSLRPAG